MSLLRTQKGLKMLITESLNHARNKAGNPSYKVIAEKAHCTARTISRIFSGETESPDTCTLENIAEALNTTLAELLSGTSTSVVDAKKIEENAKLSAEVEALKVENAHLKEIIELKDEIIRLLSVK